MKCSCSPILFGATRPWGPDHGVIWKPLFINPEDVTVMMNTTVEELPILLQKAREYAVNTMRNTLATHDLTEQQWRVIRSTFESGELNAQELARKSAILGPSLSRILNRLEEDGILNRKVSAADQRELNISLTAKGKRLHNKVLPTLHNQYDEIGKQIGNAKLEQLAGLLNYVISLQ